MNPVVVGHAAMYFAVLTWAGWIVAVRGSASLLGPLDLAVLRYATPALLLAPVWLRLGPLPKGVSRRRIAIMSLGWGAPFSLLSAKGLQDAEVSLFVALVPGMMPLWLAALATVFLGFRPGGRALAGLGLVALAGLAAGFAAPADTLIGAPWLVAASISWAAYTLAFRGSGLTAIEATAVVSFWSTVMLIPPALWFGLRLPELTLPQFAAQMLAHGVVAGVGAVLAFAAAVRALGAQRAAGFTVLVPALATLGGWLWLAETPSPAQLAAVVLAMAGVALVNSAPARI